MLPTEHVSVCPSHLCHLDIEMLLHVLWAQVVFGPWVYIKFYTLVGGKAGRFLAFPELQEAAGKGEH